MKASAAKQDNLNSSHESHKVEGKKSIPTSCPDSHTKQNVAPVCILTETHKVKC